MERAKKKVNAERERRRFDKAFKLEAVRLLEAGQKPASQLAAELGLNRHQLYTWQKQLQKRGSEGAFRGPGKLPLAEQDEIARLKHELAKVTQERDILKKAAAYFARELT